MKCQILFFPSPICIVEKNKKNITNMASSALGPRVVKDLISAQTKNNLRLSLFSFLVHVYVIFLFHSRSFMGFIKQKSALNIHKMCRFRSSCACVKYHQGLCSPFIHSVLSDDSVCLFVLRFYGPVNPMGSCQVWSVYLTTRLLGRLSPLSG